MSARTPGPWVIQFGDDEDAAVPYFIVGADDTNIVETDSGFYGPKLANAEFIVRACNAHDELLEALELMVSLPVRYNDNHIEIDCGSHGEALAIVRKARAAIDKATGGTP
jgi:hypothetical protein